MTEPEKQRKAAQTSFLSLNDLICFHFPVQFSILNHLLFVKRQFTEHIGFQMSDFGKKWERLLFLNAEPAHF